MRRVAGLLDQHVGEQRLHGQLHGERAVQLVDLAGLAQRRLDDVAVVVVALRGTRTLALITAHYLQTLHLFREILRGSCFIVSEVRIL